MTPSKLCNVCARAIKQASRSKSRNFSSKGKNFSSISPKLGSSINSIDINSMSLKKAIPGLSEAKYLKQADVKPFNTELTVLENGLRVATEPHYGMYCTVGGMFNILTNTLYV
ncbi:unnamed protein product [Thelazia callipaeda]|uniref:Adipocyte plasma membrane-associated protein n=1 Tax=Thelazia callipaeda TaxID=103827 RepID=A0A0N5CRB6_THECL|nr:unnamed protein product [Thelazia callipaeda]